MDDCRSKLKLMTLENKMKWTILDQKQMTDLTNIWTLNSKSKVNVTF